MIYIHIPYCHQKCTYCAFYSTASKKGREEYVEALCHEIAFRANERDKASSVKTVYFGGGTPSILPPKQIGKIIDHLRKYYLLQEVEEATIECNPEDLTAEYLHEIASLQFFNRLSIGVQSLDNSRLHLLNRRHTCQDVEKGIDNAEQAGFENISIDLIYGQPGESVDDWKEELDSLTNLTTHHPSIKHLSAYALTVEDGTMLHRQIQQGITSAPDENITLQHYNMLQQWVAANGFEQYEVSNYCKKGFASRHNSRYWDSTPYMGFGAAAHSFDGTHRRWNVANTTEYINGVASHSIYYDGETLTAADAHNEYIMTALRTPQGIAKDKISTPYQASLDKKIQKYISTGLIVENNRYYQPTPKGLLQADGIAADLFVD